MYGIDSYMRDSLSLPECSFDFDVAAARTGVSVLTASLEYFLYVNDFAKARNWAAELFLVKKTFPSGIFSLPPPPPLSLSRLLSFSSRFDSVHVGPFPETKESDENESPSPTSKWRAKA